MRGAIAEGLGVGRGGGGARGKLLDTGGEGQIWGGGG